MIAKKVLLDIRFWIIFFFVIRLIGITNPPLEVEHNWRQTTVTMVSRNFLEIDNNILFPRIDIGGENTGITGMEFPLLNYIIYLFSELFSYQHWYGRLINLLVSSIGLWYFYLLIKKYFNIPIAFNATFILAVSIWFQFSRKIMPDTFSMSFIIAGIYYATQYLETQQKKYDLLILFCSVLLIVLGVLSKLPSAYILIIFIFFYFDKNIRLARKALFAILLILGFIPIIAWYFYWVPYLTSHYGLIHFFMGKSITTGIHEIIEHMSQTCFRFYDTALKYIGFVTFIFGLLFAFVQIEKKIYWIFIVTFIGFLVIVLKAGFTFPHHSYYVIPFVPVMALVAGYGISLIKNTKVAIIILSAIAIEGIANQIHDFRINENFANLYQLEKDLDKVSKPSELILINSGEYPTPMYFAHRKGWVNFNNRIKDEQYIENLKLKGLRYIVILKKCYSEDITLPHYSKVFDNEDYSIYQL